MARNNPPQEPTYSVGTVVRATGLSPHVLRAWERRYGAVCPARTPGGTRRYRESDVARLRLLQRALERGQRIGAIAHLPDDELARRVAEVREAGSPVALEDARRAAARLDGFAIERTLGRHLAALGARWFVEQVLEPLLREFGERWSQGDRCVAQEHLVSTTARSLLGAVLRPPAAVAGEPLLVFATPAGERHELGLLGAAVIAADAGVPVGYLGADLPAGETVAALRGGPARGVVLGIPHLARSQATAWLREVRAGSPAHVAIWVGGRVGREIQGIPGVAPVASYEELERRVALLPAHAAARGGR